MLLPRPHSLHHFALRCCRHLTFYQELGIPITASKAEIKRAYFEKAKECHPDLNPDDEAAAAQFHKIQLAHDTLMDPRERSMYNHKIKSHFANGGYSGNRGNYADDTQYYTPGEPHPANRYKQSKEYRAKDNYTSPKDRNYEEQYRGFEQDENFTSHIFDLNDYVGFLKKWLYASFVLVSGWIFYEYTLHRAKTNYHLEDLRRDKGPPSSPSSHQGKSSGSNRHFLYNDEKGIFYETTDEEWREWNNKTANDTLNKEKTDIDTALGLSETAEEKKKDDVKITWKSLRLMKEDLNTKKDDYLTAKSSYNKALDMYNETKKEKLKEKEMREAENLRQSELKKSEVESTSYIQS